MKTSDNLNEIARALSKFQGSLTTVKKDTKAYNYKYATLSSIWDMIRHPLSENGLTVLQDTFTHEHGISVSTRVLHISGQWVEFGPLVVPMSKNDAHSAGSATSYGRRYGLCTALGIVTEEEDDDAQKVQDTFNKQPVRSTKILPVSVKEETRIEPFSEEQLEKWIDKWKEKYDKNILKEYVEARAQYHKHTPKQSAAELANDETSFLKNIDIWIKKKEKTQHVEK